MNMPNYSAQFLIFNSLQIDLKLVRSVIKLDKLAALSLIMLIKLSLLLT